jgi:RNA ligase (TIGR02306 family)
MAELKVEIFKIDEVKEHPNADRMELAYIGAWQSCVPIGKFKAGDRAVYIPVDSILPHDVENILFPPGSKITLKKSRVRSIKLRGAMSQGMLEMPETLGLPPNIKVGTDVAEKLDIKKYMPPAKSVPGIMKAKKKRHKNPDFKVYTDIGHFKYYHRCLDGMEVFATEKVHGTNFRCGYVKYNAYNWWRRLLAPLFRPFGMMKYDFAYGSHRVELTRRSKRTTGFYKENIYYMMAEQYKLKEILCPGEVVYAEIYGHGIQKGYAYGCKEGEWKMVIVDVMINGKYLDGIAAKVFCRIRDLPFAPVVYIGEFTKYDEMNAIANPPGDKSVLYPDLEKPIEGIVIKPGKEQKGYMGRMVFKWINDKYWLDKSNTDFH